MIEAQYLLSADIDEVRVGDSYDESLPPHITVMPWFELGNSGEAQLVGICHSVISTAPTVETIATERTQCDINEDVMVTRVKKTAELDNLHNDLLRRLGNVTVNLLASTNRLGKDWEPHVSDTVSKILDPGEVVRIQRVHLFKRKKPSATQHAILGFTLGSARRGS